MAARTRIISLSFLLATLPAVAHANVGHLGELAGHSHWAGVAALAAAAAVAGVMALKARRGREQDAPKSEPASEPDAEAAEG